MTYYEARVYDTVTEEYYQFIYRMNGMESRVEMLTVTGDFRPSPPVVTPLRSIKTPTIDSEFLSQYMNEEAVVTYID